MLEWSKALPTSYNIPDLLIAKRLCMQRFEENGWRWMQLGWYNRLAAEVLGREVLESILKMAEHDVVSVYVGRELWAVSQATRRDSCCRQQRVSSR